MHLPVGPRRAGAPDRARLDHFRLRRSLEDQDLAAYAAARLAALDEFARALAAAPPGPGWRPLGPFAIPHGRTAGSGPGSRPRLAGRVAAVAIGPDDPGHLLAGAGAGGIWESRDGGRRWRPRTDDQPSLAIGAVAFAPGSPAVVYAGTGQGEALAALGVGLLRSEDGGATWRLLVAPELLGAGFHDLLVDPGDAGRLLAATSAGLWASRDGGIAWERRLAGRAWAVSAGAGGELLAGGEHGVHRSEDGGATWRPVALASAPVGFDRVAVAHGAGGQVAYVFAAGDGVGHLWRRDHANGPFDPVKPPADLQSQHAWHNWACAADPGDPNVVWLGAFGLHRGARGAGGRWSWVDLAARPAGDSVPPAQHAVVFAPGDPGTLYVANDGGLFRSPDGGRSWRSLGTGLAVAEVDQLADRPGDHRWLLAGAGALGTLRYEGTEVWSQVGTGDQLPQVGTQVVPPQAGATVTAVAADPQHPEIVWAAWSGPRGWRVWRSGDGGVSWDDRSGQLPAVPVSALALDPDRPGTVFAATDAGVWRCVDDGAGWHPFGNGLPNAPALALALHGPGRLLRVGLLGRGVWEVALDDAPGPAAATPALRASRSRPEDGTGGWWWECPDIKVEAWPAPASGPVEPVEFQDDRGPAAAGLLELGGRVRPGQPARVHVQVHLRGGLPLRGVRVRVLAVPACLRPPNLPGGGWVMGGDPPPGSPWRSVGPPGVVGELEPGRAGVASFDWDVPPDMTRGVCLLAVAAADGAETAPAGDLAGLVASDGPWGLKNLTVLGPGAEGGPPGRGSGPPPRTRTGAPRTVRLELWAVAGEGPLALAAEGWVHQLTAGLVLGRRLAGPALAAGLVPGRLAEPWRPELVALVQEDLSLAERLDLAAAFPLPAGHRDAGVRVWLQGIELPPDQAEPLVLLLREPPPTGGGALLLLDAGGRVVGGHTLQAPP